MNCGECGDRPVEESGCDRVCMLCHLCQVCSGKAILSLIEQVLDLIAKGDPDRAVDVIERLSPHDLVATTEVLIGRAYAARLAA